MNTKQQGCRDRAKSQFKRSVEFIIKQDIQFALWRPCKADVIIVQLSCSCGEMKLKFLSFPGLSLSFICRFHFRILFLSDFARYHSALSLSANPALELLVLVQNKDYFRFIWEWERQREQRQLSEVN